LAQVPYSGVTSVASGGIPQSRYHVDISEATFGGNVGAAMGSLGGQLQRSGNELFERGIAMQTLYNQSEAQEADAKYMEVAGKFHAEYNTLQGKAAVDAYPMYIDNLKKARQEIAKGMSNDMSKKLFESASNGTMGRSIFNGAGHAAGENKKYAINSVDSQIENQTNLAATSSSPRDVEAARQRLKGLSAQRSALLGQDPDSAAGQQKTINSSLDFNVINHMAKADPFKAAEELDKRKDGMTAKDYDRALVIVDNTKRSVGSVNIAQEVISAHIGDDGKPNVPFEQMQREAEAKAKAAAPNDAVMVKHTGDALRGLYNQKVYADKQFRWENTQTVDAAIQDGVVDIQQLRAKSPQVAAAIDSLPQSEQLKLPARINAYNAARDKVASQDSLTRLTGLRNNDVEAFLNLDPTDPKLALSQAQQREVMNWQRQDKKNQNSDPRVNRALSWLRQARGGELAALGVYRRDGKNPEDYDQMTGTLQSAMDLWQQSKGKPPTYDEVINVIGPQVIKSRATPGWLWGINNEPFYKPDVNSEEYKLFKRKATDDVVNSGAVAPTDAEIDRAYTRMQLLKLYPKKTGTTSGK
jgi:hypothetical protein